MDYKIDIFPETHLIGLRREMSFSDDRTFNLWRSLMPRREEIKNQIQSELFSVQLYPQGFFEHFDAGRKFEKWAAVATSAFDNIPNGMETLAIPGGLYAVFRYKAAVMTAPEAFRYIFSKWLPGSGYQLDCRPHFEILGEKYKRGSADSEEDIFIPIIIPS
ncbi:MAG TPA: GyrI-like domain-containing protein [Flavobacterium sp.]|jgi:AraC family transcriptional regulator